MDEPRASIVVFGGSGLIGGSVAEALMRAGHRVVPVARRFTRAQRATFSQSAVEADVTQLGTEGLGRLLGAAQCDVVLNCMGVLQDGPGGRADRVNLQFVLEIIAALEALSRPAILLQVSVPGEAAADRTAFSRTKHEADEMIIASGLPYVILRPGFIVAPIAFGGGALVRALAAMPIRLPGSIAGRPFAVADIADLAKVIAVVIDRWRNGERDWGVVWDVMELDPEGVEDVVEVFRRRFGGPAPLILAPLWLLRASALAGDLIAQLGWSPPVRTTALRELLRGVEGDPTPCAGATGVEPTAVVDAVARLPPSIQEVWFGRLFLAKPLVFGSLVLFWTASGLIALGPGFEGASQILISHGFSPILGRLTATLSSLSDTGVGLMIALRPTCRIGLLVGLGLSLAYLGGAAIIAPELWIEPLGALVKTVPAIVLMLVALAMLPNR